MLKLLSGACAGGAGAAVGIPALRALLDTRGKKTVSGDGDLLRVASADAIPSDGSPIKLPVVIEAPKDAWVLLPPTEIGSVYVQKVEGELIAYSTVCPHLGCSIDYVAARKQFACPCHESAFDSQGKVIGGPSPRAMDRLEARVAGDAIEVRYVRFMQGTKARIPQ